MAPTLTTDRLVELARHGRLAQRTRAWATTSDPWLIARTARKVCRLSSRNRSRETSAALLPRERHRGRSRYRQHRRLHAGRRDRARRALGVAVRSDDHRLVAAGRRAERSLGRTPPHLRTVRPLADGIVSDLHACETMLRAFIQRISHRRWVKPRVVMCVPSGVTGVEQRAVLEVAEAAGARKPVHLIEEPVAAAIGAGLPVHDPVGNLVVDIGGGTTEIGVVSLGGLVTSRSARVGGRAIDEAIVTFAKAEYGVAIGERTAELVKVRHASARPSQDDGYVDLVGSAADTGLPKAATASTSEIRQAISHAARGDRRRRPGCPRPHAARTRGRHDAGRHRRDRRWGDAAGMPTFLSEELALPVFLADDPLHSVVRGAGLYLQNL